MTKTHVRRTGGSRIAGLRRVALATVAAAALASAGVAAAKDQPMLAPLPDAPKFDEAKAKIGQMLFFDTRLSGDTSLSCASCHDPAKGWGDLQALSAGYTGVQYFRNSPGLFNVASKKYLLWDGRLDGSDLGTMVRDMLTEAHTMNMDSRLAQERLKQVPEYAEAIAAAYKNDPYGGIIYGAIGEFLKTIRTKDAPLDKFLRGDQAALSAEQVKGKALFEGKAGCVSCHNGPMLSDGKQHALGVPEHAEITGNPERHISMLRHFSTMGTPNFMNLREDVGQYVVTKDKADWGKFSTPSLWDVGQTAPYMHNGVLASLEQVVDFYDRGTKATKPLKLTADEKKALLAFLQSMTGAKPAVAAPATQLDYQVRPLGKN